jgi:phage N-6-adenine-methyltransferase
MSDEWGTPPGVFNAVDRAFGPFDLDVAATAENTLCPAHFTADDDGLSQPWKGRVWANPPYSRIVPGVNKAAAEVKAGRAEVVVMLVPSRTGAQWWRDAIEPGAHAVYWPRRIEFIGDQPHRAPFDSALLVFGDAPRRITAICRNCDDVFIAKRGATTCSDRCRAALYRAKGVRNLRTAPAKGVHEASTTGVIHAERRR